MSSETANVTVYPDLAGLCQATAEFWVQRAAKAVATHGSFAVALTGGSTPRGLYELLATPGWRSQIEWPRWHVFWGDDRFVPPHDPNSNYGLARTTLLDRVPIPLTQVHPISTDAANPEQAAAAYEDDLRTFFALAPGDWPRFDLVLLGMGADGHVASLFPGNASLQERQRLVVASPPGPLPPPVPRVTLTLPVLNAARAVAFLVAGAEKAEPLRAALRGDEQLPAARIKPTAGELHWFVDAAAAGRVPNG